MANRMPGRCPVCGDAMEITSLHCPTCDTTIAGHFSTCKFCELSQEMQDFVSTFIRSRGNIKEVERALGISYPTVRGRLDAVIKALGYAVDGLADEAAELEVPVPLSAPASPPADQSSGANAPAASGERRREILAALSRGEISAQEAAARLRQP